MADTLHGTVALVTGASSGIGAATAAELAQHGAKVAVAARRRDRLADLATRIGELGSGALVLETDVTVESEVRDAVAATVEHFGRLDTVIAGVYNLTKHGVGAFADAIGYIVTRPRRVAVNEMLIRPTEQEG